MTPSPGKRPSRLFRGTKAVGGSSSLLSEPVQILQHELFAWEQHHHKRGRGTKPSRGILGPGPLQHRAVGRGLPGMSQTQGRKAHCSGYLGTCYRREVEIPLCNSQTRQATAPLQEEFPALCDALNPFLASSVQTRLCPHMTTGNVRAGNSEQPRLIWTAIRGQEDRGKHAPCFLQQEAG